MVQQRKPGFEWNWKLKSERRKKKFARKEFLLCVCVVWTLNKKKNLFIDGWLKNYQSSYIQQISTEKKYKIYTKQNTKYKENQQQLYFSNQKYNMYW